MRRLSKSALALAAATVAGLGMFTPAAHAATAPTSGTSIATFTPTDDAYGAPRAPKTVTGTSTKLVAEPVGGKVAYLRFAVSGLPAGASVTGASLHVTRFGGHPIPPLTAHRVASNSWSERSLVAANAPSVGAAIGGSTTTDAGVTADLDVAAVVSGNGVVSVALRARDAGTIARLQSRQAPTGKPTLSVRWVHPVASSSTLIGVSPQPRNGETWGQSVARSNNTYGAMDVIRAFNTGTARSWALYKTQVGNTPLVVSFKAQPKDVIAGRVDSYYLNWFATAPRDHITYWTYFHEPENDIEAGSFTAADYRAAWVHLAALANRAGNPKLKSTLILMGWSAQPASKRNWLNYYPGSATIDVLGWDVYQHGADKGVYQDPQNMFEEVMSVSKGAGKPWAVAEVGSKLAPGDAGSRRAQWLVKLGQYLKSQRVAFVTYFDSKVGGDFRLLDAPSAQAWRQVNTGS